MKKIYTKIKWVIIFITIIFIAFLINQIPAKAQTLNTDPIFYLANHEDGLITGNYLFKQSRYGNWWIARDGNAVNDNYIGQFETGYKKNITTCFGKSTAWRDFIISDDGNKLVIGGGLALKYSNDQCENVNSYNDNFTTQNPLTSLTGNNDFSYVAYSRYSASGNILARYTTNFFTTLNTYTNYTSNLMYGNNISCDNNGVYCLIARQYIDTARDIRLCQNNSCSVLGTTLRTTGVESINVSDSGQYMIYNHYNNGLKYSQDHGTTWTTLTIPSGNLTIDNDIRGVYVNDSGIILYTTIANNNVWVSQDNGINWFAIDSLTNVNYKESNFNIHDRGLSCSEHLKCFFTLYNTTGGILKSYLIDFTQYGPVWDNYSGNINLNDGIKIDNDYFKLLDSFGDGDIIPNDHWYRGVNSITLKGNTDDIYWDEYFLNNEEVRYYLTFKGEAKTTSTRIVIEKLDENYEKIEDYFWLDYTSANLLSSGWNSILKELEFHNEIYNTSTMENFYVYRINVIEKWDNNSFTLADQKYIIMIKTNDEFTAIPIGTNQSGTWLNNIFGNTIGNFIQGIFNPVFSGIQTGITATNIFPISLITEVINSWNSAGSINSDSNLDLMIINKTQETQYYKTTAGSIYINSPQNWAENTTDKELLVWGHGIFGKEEISPIFDTTRYFSTWILWALFILYIWKFGTKVFKEINE